MSERPRANISAWLRERTPQHLELLDRMRDALTRHLPAGGDVLPDRDWARVYNLYQQGFHSLLVEERERAKLQLLANRSGAEGHIPDDELDAELRKIGIDALKELPTADLAIELANRGLTMPAVVERDDSD